MDDRKFQNKRQLAEDNAQDTRDVLIFLKPIARKIIFGIAVVFCCLPFVSPALALLLGIVIAQVTGHPYVDSNQKITNFLLKLSVVGLGFGMNFHNALQAGKEGIIFTIVSIIGTLIFGYLIGKWLQIEQKTSYLISTGTAICGGSAIAAIAPVINAQEKQISIALGCVFILNSIALFVFPFVGNYFHLSQSQFGLWCAIAIHDTSSVVGAAAKYGPHALEVATIVKLSRALWIIPIAFLSTFLFKNKSKKISIPYFIGLFLIAMMANTYMPVVSVISPYVTAMAKVGLTLTLFLIGAGLSKNVLKSVGLKPFLQASLLWIFISVMSLYVIVQVV